MSALLTLEEAAALLRSSPETVSAWIKHRGLPAAKPGRNYLIVHDDLIAWLRLQSAANDKGEACDSTDEGKSGGPTFGTRAGALEEALRPRKKSPRGNGPTPSKQGYGEKRSSENVVQLPGTRRS